MITNADSTNWGVFATVFGLVTVSEYAGQFATSLLTLVVCIVTAHFVKRFLNHRWPQQPSQPQRARRRKTAKAATTEPPVATPLDTV